MPLRVRMPSEAANERVSDGSADSPGWDEARGVTGVDHAIKRSVVQLAGNLACSHVALETGFGKIIVDHRHRALRDQEPLMRKVAGTQELQHCIVSRIRRNPRPEEPERAEHHRHTDTGPCN